MTRTQGKPPIVLRLGCPLGRVVFFFMPHSPHSDANRSKASVSQSIKRFDRAKLKLDQSSSFRDFLFAVLRLDDKPYS